MMARNSLDTHTPRICAHHQGMGNHRPRMCPRQQSLSSRHHRLHPQHQSGSNSARHKKGAHPPVRAFFIYPGFEPATPYFTTSTLSSHFSCFSKPTRLATVAAMLERPAVSVCLRPSLPPLTLSKRTSGTGLRVWAVLAL